MGTRVGVDSRSRTRWRRSLARGGVGLSLAAVALTCATLDPAASRADEPAHTGGAAVAGPEIVLRKGDRGRAVEVVQRRLRIDVDGVFGAGTHRAVKRFQRRIDLVTDGIVGPKTRRQLNLRPFSRSSVVRPRGGKGSGIDADGSVADAEEGLANLPKELVRIAECESGSNPRAVSASGRYRGKYQFMRSTWREWGGRGDDPATSSEAHQDRVALRLYRARGAAPWPGCAG